jgi:ABC-type lipoprotein release transport system permease subunit
MIGRLLSVTGEAVYTATETASLLVLRSKEIEEARKKLEAGAYVVDEHGYSEKNHEEQQVLVLTIKNSEYDSNTSSTSTQTQRKLKDTSCPLVTG